MDLKALNQDTEKETTTPSSITQSSRTREEHKDPLATNALGKNSDIASGPKWTNMDGSIRSNHKEASENLHTHKRLQPNLRERNKKVEETQTNMDISARSPTKNYQKASTRAYGSINKTSDPRLRHTRHQKSRYGGENKRKPTTSHQITDYAPKTKNKHQIKQRNLDPCDNISCSGKRNK